MTYGFAAWNSSHGVLVDAKYQSISHKLQEPSVSNVPTWRAAKLFYLTFGVPCLHGRALTCVGN
uniref:Uncharacterized protein n=1 Tax=Arundo donax TaxID=35708 RepID=A0A0A9EUL8_ARUDO